MTAQRGSALVFGGASGLGEATARRLARRYQSVVIADRDGPAAAACAAQINGTAVTCDVTEETAVQAAVTLAANVTGGLRAVVNCAGIAPAAKLVGRHGPAPAQHFAAVIAVNLLGTITTLRLAAEAMKGNSADDHASRGVFIATASIAAFDGQIGQVAYAASKGGIASLILPAARELATSGIRVMAIAPGLFETPLLAGLPAATQASLADAVPFPNRLGNPNEFAALVEHITTNPMLNGEVIRLDGAIRMGPR